MPLENETVTLRADDVEAILTACGCYAPDGGTGDLGDRMQRVHLALHADRVPAGEPEPAPVELPLPPGRFGRVELPGWRNHTGFLAEEIRFGQQVMVVRDFNGAEVANVIIGPMCQVIYLPAPLKRPEPQAALPAGRGEDQYEEDDGEVYVLPGELF